MSRCVDCRFEGPYNIKKTSQRHYHVTEAGVGEMKYMRCQVPGGGPTESPISMREALADEPCSFFQPKKEPKARSEPPKEKTVAVEADSLENAEKQVRSQMPEGMLLISERVISAGEPNTAQAVADTTDEAFAQAEAKLPAGATVLEKKELTAPGPKVITVEAFDQDSAKSQAMSQFGSTTTVKSLKLKASGNKGFLGIGKKPNLYEVEILQRSVVEITYRSRAEISATYGDSCVFALERIRQSESLWVGAEREETLGIVRTESDRLQSVAERHPPGVPFVTAVDDRAMVVVRMESLPQYELERMQDAVKHDKIALVPQLAKYPQYPVLNLAFLIFDVPTDPYAAEGFSNIAVGDVQDFVLAVAREGKGQLHLHGGTEAELAASGTFTLIMPSLRFDAKEMTFPMGLTNHALVDFGTLLLEAAEYLAEIPASQRDFNAAANRYMKST